MGCIVLLLLQREPRDWAQRADHHDSNGTLKQHAEPDRSEGWPGPLVIRSAFASALRETGLQLPSGEKAREVRPSLLDNPILCSPVCRPVIANKGYVSSISGPAP